MDIGRFWGKARPLDPDRGPQWHPLAHHSLDVAAVGDALLRSHPRLGESFARLLRLPLEDAASLICYLLCLHDIGKFAKKFQAKTPTLYPECFGDDPARLATQFDHGAEGLRLFDADPDRFQLPDGARPRAWPPLIAAVTGGNGQIFTGETKQTKHLTKGHIHPSIATHDGKHRKHMTKSNQHAPGQNEPAKEDANHDPPRQDRRSQDTPVRTAERGRGR